MKSEWRIASHKDDAGIKWYQCYRIRDVDKTDHSGNREEDPREYLDRDVAVIRCNVLNKGGQE